ncbi:MAG: hypothetical protein ABI207_03280 [Crocinitomicaceae bacterium]
MDIKEISKEINKNAHDKGFWDEGIDIPKKLLLAVSELCEAMEADRKDRNTDTNYLDEMIAEGYTWKNSEYSFINSFEKSIKDSFEDELADAAIRIFDLAFEMGIDLPKHIEMKHRYNCTRPKMHNKKY